MGFAVPQIEPSKFAEKLDEVDRLDLVQVESLKEAIVGELALAEDLIVTYEEECSVALKQLDESFAQNDLARIRQLAHFLAGSSANMGLKRMSASCRTIENSDDGMVTAYKSAMVYLMQEFKQSIADLRKAFGLS